MKEYDLKLLLLFLLLAGSILLRVAIKPDGYISPDSEYYLQIAQNVLDGKGLVMLNPRAENPETAPQIPVTVWPAGYPIAIVTAALLTGLPVFWASKLLNILFLGGCFLLLRGFSKQKAWLLGLVFCSHSYLQVFSYTWSEVPFLFFEILFALSLCKVLADAPKHWWFWLLASTIGLFMFRYIGLFAIPLLGLAGLWYCYRNEAQKGLKLLATGFIAGCFVLVYFYRNYLLHGTLTGGERVFEGRETTWQFIWKQLYGLLNEFALFLHHYRNISNGAAFWILAALQIAWLGWLYQKYVHHRVIFSFKNTDTGAKMLMLTGISYLGILTAYRFMAPFSYDNRLLAPLSMPVYLAVLLILFSPEYKEKTQPLEKHLLAFFMFSLLINVGQLFVRFVF